jgi:hypothetical protein
MHFKVHVTSAFKTSLAERFVATLDCAVLGVVEDAEDAAGVREVAKIA